MPKEIVILWEVCAEADWSGPPGGTMLSSVFLEESTLYKRPMLEQGEGTEKIRQLVCKNIQNLLLNYTLVMEC